MIVCLYYCLKKVPYEICRAGGPGHQVIVPLHINNPSKTPSHNQPFEPFFSVEKLKELIGRKGRLYIRPLITVKGSSRVTEVEVSVHKVFGVVWLSIPLYDRLILPERA